MAGRRYYGPLPPRYPNLAFKVNSFLICFVSCDHSQHFVCSRVPFSGDSRKRVLDVNSGNLLPRIQIFREEPCRAAGGRALIPKNAFGWPILAGFARVGVFSLVPFLRRFRHSTALAAKWLEYSE